MNHFLERHTFEYVDFNQIKTANTSWPRGIDVSAMVEEALTYLDNQVPPVRPVPFARPPIKVRLSNGIEVIIASNRSNEIGQFYPSANPSLAVIDFTMDEMKAFKDILLP